MRTGMPHKPTRVSLTHSDEKKNFHRESGSAGGFLVRTKNRNQKKSPPVPPDLPVNPLLSLNTGEGLAAWSPPEGAEARSAEHPIWGRPPSDALRDPRRGAARRVGAAHPKNLESAH